MAPRVEADLEVQRFGFTGDESGKRLLFPRAHLGRLEGRGSTAGYGAAEASFEALEGRLDTLRWTAEAASLGKAWLRDDSGRVELSIERLELPRGVMLVRAERGVELLAPHASLSELRLSLRGPFDRAPAPGAAATPPAAPAAQVGPVDPGLRQPRLRFLDSLAGRIDFTVKVRLDLPVIGERTLDQVLRVPIADGSLDFRALEDSLDWLEGAFLDIAAERERLALRWKVPIFGSRDLVSWALDGDATTLASFGRVPVRALADFRVGSGRASDARDRKRKVLQALSLDAIDVALAMHAPRSLEVGGGLIMFGGDDAQGLVDLKVSGAIHDHGPGALRGAIGSIDTTLKDLQLGPLGVTADRLHVDGIDGLEVTFDGFTPIGVVAIIHRVTATNLALTIR